MVVFAQSPFRFTDPIRYFKANDPIYYEVDNIPLKQLQENDLWIKDQLSKLELPELPDAPEVGRSTFNELQPYVDGSDNFVYVKPGRFTARINDILNSQALQKIIKESTTDYVDSFEVLTNRDLVVTTILNKFKTQIQANALGMNGLTERAFTRASSSREALSQSLAPGVPGYSVTALPTSVPTPPYPGKLGQLYITNRELSSIPNIVLTFNTEGWIESQFIKKWRGVARTSIVDVQDTLEIEIPPFDENDFYYTDENGNRQTLTAATQRIDLLFIYSKPIDASAATIAKYTNNSNTPTKITVPTLGIVKGAGLGVNLRNNQNSPNRADGTIPIQDADGNQMIVPNISDEVGANLGIGSVKGSFPSPDDLMNLAPTLLEDLESNNIHLLGQSILPVAYVIVKKAATTSEGLILGSEDLIDIRPFFRTTELAYNERAGIAAAHPQISIANPVASEEYVDSISKELSDRVTEVELRIPELPPLTPRVVSTGYVLGGGFYGVEAVLSEYIKKENPTLYPNATVGSQARTDLFNTVAQRFNYPAGLVNRGDPDWDRASWAEGTNASYIDWLNIVQQDVFSRQAAVDFGAPFSWFDNFEELSPSIWGTNPGANRENEKIRIRELARGFTDSVQTGFGNLVNIGTTYPTGPNNFQFRNLGMTEGTSYSDFAYAFVKKKLILSTQATPWAVDYMLKASYHNCTTRGYGPNNIIVTKEKNIQTGNIEFTIVCGWSIKPKLFPRSEFSSQAVGNTIESANFYISHPENQGAIFPLYHKNNTSECILCRNWAGTFVMTNTWANDNRNPGRIEGQQSANTGPVYGASRWGVALYPSIKYEIIGIPPGFGHEVSRFGTNNVVNTL